MSRLLCAIGLHRMKIGQNWPGSPLPKWCWRACSCGRRCQTRANPNTYWMRPTWADAESEPPGQCGECHHWMKPGERHEH